MPSRTPAFNTAPRLNYRQSKVMETPFDKSIPSSPCYDTNPYDATSVIAEEPYCAAPPPQESSAVTNKATNTHRNKSGDDVSDNGCTSSSSSDCAETLSKTNDSHSLLLRKATSQSSMNLTTLLDNGAPLQHDDIIPRPTKSEPYSFTLIQSEEQQQESDGDPDDNDNDWNRGSLLDNGDGGDIGKEDTTNLEDVIWIKRKSLQTRLFNIITKTIDHELRRHTSTAANSPRQQQQQLMTLDDDQSPFDKDGRSSDPSGAPSPSSPSPSVSQWWQQQHVALEKTITTQQQVFTTTMDELKRRLDSLERAHHDYILQQQKQQQQTKSQQGQDSQEELKKYNALHARYIDLVTQHSHQLEKYQQLEQAHFSQSNKLRLLELKHLQKPTHRHQQIPPPPSATAMLPSPPLNTVQKQYKTEDQQNIHLDQQKKKKNAMDRQQQQAHHHQQQQQQQQHFRHPHHQHHSNYSHTVTSSPTNAHIQKSRFTSTAQPILPTPNASPTSTTIISSPKEPVTSFANQQPPSTAQQKQQQSFKMDAGYVEFMTECNGEPVLCRVKIPTKDAEMHDGYNNNKSPAEFVSQSRQTKPNPRYHQHQYHNNVNNKDMNARTQSPTTQGQYHTSSPRRQQQHQQQQHHYPQRQGHYQQQQQQYQYHHTNQYQHPYKSWQAPLPTTNKKTLNPDAPVWTGSWQTHH